VTEPPPAPVSGGGLAGLARRLRADPALGRLIANSTWLLGARGLTMPLAFVESVLVARALGVERFGELGVVMAAVALAHKVLSFRMNEFVVQFVSRALVQGRKDEAGAALKAALAAELATAAAAYALAWLLAPWIAGAFLDDPAAAWAIRLYGLVILGDAVLESTSGALQAFDRFNALARMAVLQRALVLGGVAAAFAAGGGLAGFLAAYVAAGALATLVQLRLTVLEAAYRIGAGWWRVPLRAALAGRGREMRRFALATNLGATLSLVVKEGDLLWISWFASPLEAGWYKLATNLLKVPFAAASPMVKAVYPELARALAAGAVAEVRRLLRRATALAAAWVVPVCLALWVLAPWLVRTFFGAGYLPAVPALRLLLIGLGVSNLFFWTRPAMLALGRAGAALKITAVNAVLKVVLVLALVPAGGYLAVAAILSALYLVGVALALGVVGGGLGRFDIQHDVR
jgi:O-antigen/teichoic acid export membrane protein